jgi:multiple sugar transport system substrate-binding protein
MKRGITRRHFLRMSGAGLAGSALLGIAGCSDSTSPGGNGNGKVTLSWWDYSVEPALEAQIDRYMEDNPNVTINRRSVPYESLNQTLLQGAAAGELPDIAVVNNPDHQAYAALGVAEDLTERIESWGEAELYFESPWATTMYQGKNYGIPVGSNCLALWYNADLLDAAGVNPPATWDELKTVAESLTEGKQFGLAVSAVDNQQAVFQWLPFLWQAGADIPTLDSDGGREALQLWVDMVEEGSMSKGILGWEQGDIADEFRSRRAAMMTNGPWEIPGTEEEAPKLNWGIAPMPTYKEAASVLGGENYMITAGGNVDAAWDVLTWTQRPENQKTYLKEAGYLPSRTDLAQEPEWSEDPALSVFVDQLQIAGPRAYGPRYPEIADVIVQAIQGAISGESAVESALATAQEKVLPLLEEE